MTLSKKGTALFAAAVAATLTLGACSSNGGGSKSPSSSNGTGSSTATTTASGATSAPTQSSGSGSSSGNDISPVPYAQVKAGGTMRWPIEDFPADFNNLTVNGNESASVDVMTGTLPQVWNYDAGGNPILDTDTMIAAAQTSTSPQTIDYKINPKAVWSNGKQISYLDFVGMWKSQNNANAKFAALDASTVGYEQIKSVTKGATAQDVKVVFKTPFADWKSLFSELFPAALTATPTSFGKSWVNGPNLSGGPFMVSKIDKTQKTITEVHNPKWYGRPAKLTSIQFIDIDPSAQPKAFASGQIDFDDIGSDPAAYATDKAVPGAKIHTAGGPNFRHIDLSERGFLSNVNVRRAVMLSFNRIGDTEAQLAPLGLKPVTLDSHIWMNSQSQYKATCGDYCNQNIAKAKSLLQGAGFTMGKDGYYAKGGKELDLKFVIPAGVSTSANEAELQQNALKAAGIKVTLQTVPSDPFFPTYVEKANFDLTIFSWLGTPFPVSGAQQIYSSKGSSNFGKIGSPAIDAMLNKAVSTTSAAEEVALSYKIDTAIWNEGHSVTLYQRPDLVATVKGLVNFGSFGFANRDYTDIGLS